MRSSNLAAFLVLSAAAGTAGAAVIPYANDFSGIGGNTALPNTTPAANWSLDTSSTGEFVNSVGSTLTTTSATIDLTNVDGATFVQEATFRLTALGTPNNTDFTVGMAAFGSSSNLATTGSDAYYLADVSARSAGTAAANTGRLRILSLGAANGDFTTVATVANTAALVVGTSYTLELTGTSLSTGALNLSLRLLDASGAAIGGTATATDPTPLTGDFFGLRNRTASTTVRFDDFNVVVPEPATAGLVAAAGMMLLRRRR